jgi:hypothetical protein
MIQSRYLFYSRAIAVLGLTVLLLLSVGCSSQFVYVPVKGKITVKGDKPVTWGAVVLTPDKDNKFRSFPRGTINPDGTYEVNSEDRAGVPIGSYIVCVVAKTGEGRRGKAPPVQRDPILFSPKYLEPDSSPLRMEVVAEPAPGTYDFVLDTK